MLSTETREEAICRLHESGHTIAQIRKLTGIRYKKVIDVINYFVNNQQVPDSPKRGRKPKVDSGMRTRIAALTVQNRLASCLKISQHMLNEGYIGVSTATVWRIRRKLEFEFKPPKIRQALSDSQKSNRVRFAHSMIYNNIDLSKIIFSDESRFSLKADNNLIWYRRGEKDDNIFVEKDKFTTSIMVYGAIGINYKSKLVACSAGVNALEYRKIMEKSEMFSDLRDKDYLFMQDGAPAHTSNLTSLFLQKRCSFIKCWPSNSPDLNPIEHLWGAMKKVIQARIGEINNKDDLLRIVNETWDNFPQESINSLVRSFECRLRMVIDNNGESISDELRSSIHRVPFSPLNQIDDYLTLDDIVQVKDERINDQPVEFKTLRQWNPDEDAALIQNYRLYGNKWNLIARFIPERTPASIRNRFKYLYK